MCGLISFGMTERYYKSVARNASRRQRLFSNLEVWLALLEVKAVEQTEKTSTLPLQIRYNKKHAVSLF